MLKSENHGKKINALCSSHFPLKERVVWFISSKINNAQNDPKNLKLKKKLKK